MAKVHRIASLRSSDPDGLDPHYAGWFSCFNNGQFYEAHDVLEALWLADRTGPDGHFYKGLIQLAGAFVHLQKGRLRPADALLRLAGGYLAAYAPRHHRLDVARVLSVMEEWRAALAAEAFAVNPLATRAPPQIRPDPPGIS